jgi:hypothetical protein
VVAGYDGVPADLVGGVPRPTHDGDNVNVIGRHANGLV